MASIAFSNHLPAVDEPHERETVGPKRQAAFHDLINLALIGKQLHRSVVGLLFRALHLRLDEFVDSGGTG